MNNTFSINQHRFLQRMQQMAEIGATPKGGVCRLTASQEDAVARKLLKEWCTELGFTTYVDAMGNQFARKLGSDPTTARILVGSHLDSQPTGGRFDGVLGVMAGLEALQRLHEEGLEHSASIDLVNWTNEEGARFAPAMMGSGVFAHILNQQQCYQSKDDQGQLFRESLEQIGWLGKDQIDHHYAASFELHIEQGPILESLATPIGIVEGVQGIRWYEAKVVGEETHAGPCPMSLRKDPVPQAAALITELYQWIAQKGEDARLTIGKMNAHPASQNTVPSEVRFSIDIRHPNENMLESMHQELLRFFEREDAELHEIWYSPPVHFHESCINDIKQATEQLGIEAHTMFSGAGHDSVYLASIVPTAMIFVPSKDGLSHNEAEYTSDDELITGANVLLNSLIHCIKRVL